jgi:hypothetical protein
VISLFLLWVRRAKKNTRNSANRVHRANLENAPIPLSLGGEILALEASAAAMNQVDANNIGNATETVVPKARIGVPGTAGG